MTESSGAMLQMSCTNGSKLVRDIRLVTKQSRARDNLQLVAFQDSKRHLDKFRGSCG